MWIDEQFPRLATEGYQITSEPDESYNCIAYAAGETNNWWTHFAEGPGYYWPDRASRTDKIESLIEAFSSLGYEPCPDDSLERGFQKVALYAKNGDWTHAAIQVEGGDWSSKLGLDEDIRHQSPDSLVGDSYGEVHCIMRRPQAT